MNFWLLRRRVLTGLLGLLANVMFAGGVQELDAARVRLLPGSPFFERQELQRSGYLASLEPDKLLTRSNIVWSSLPAKAKWCAPGAILATHRLLSDWHLVLQWMQMGTSG